MDSAVLQHDLQELHDNKRTWARLAPVAKIHYLREIRGLVMANADGWVGAGAELKGLTADSPVVAEEWLSGPYPTVTWLNDVIETLTAIDRGEDPLAGFKVRTTTSGQTAVRVLPHTTYDRLLLSGYELDVWMEPGVTAGNVPLGEFYKQTDPMGRVTLVLGAGNVSAIPMLDTLYSLFADGDVVVLKMNPVNEVYGPVFERILAPLIRDGFLRIVYGGAEVGAQLTGSDSVDAIHITGSERTFNTIVYGPGEPGETRRQQDAPVLAKPIRSELGGVGPTIVLPGPWTQADIAYQAEHLATQKLHNAGHTCVASQILVMPQHWDQAPALMSALREAFRTAPDRQPFYPGTGEKLAVFAAHNPGTEVLSEAQPRMLLPEVDADSGHPAFQEEFFGPIYVSTTLPGADPATYLRNAVAFVNDRLHGNLGVNLIVHPATEKQLGAALDEAIAELRYGSIGINVWSAFGFLASRAAWGAYPGNTPQDIQSGTGVVHNALLFDKPQKNVIQAPFRAFPRSARHGHHTMAVKPPWFVNNRTATATARRLTEFAADPKPHRLVGLFASALRG